MLEISPANFAGLFVWDPTAKNIFGNSILSNCQERRNQQPLKDYANQPSLAGAPRQQSVELEDVGTWPHPGEGVPGTPRLSQGAGGRGRGEKYLPRKFIRI